MESGTGPSNESLWGKLKVADPFFVLSLSLFFSFLFSGFFSFFLSGLLFLAKAFFDGSIVLFVIELAEVIRFSLHALGDLLFYNSNYDKRQRYGKIAETRNRGEMQGFGHASRIKNISLLFEWGLYLHLENTIESLKALL